MWKKSYREGELGRFSKLLTLRGLKTLAIELD